MKIQHIAQTFLRRLPVVVAGLVIAVTGVATAHAQDDDAGASAAGLPAGTVEGSTLGTFADPSSQGNTVQSARAVLGQGMRELKQSQKLEEKAAGTDDTEKATKWLEKSREANANAIQLLTQALQQNDKLIDGYEALGLAYRREGKYQEAMQVHAVGLGKDPDSLANFRGWSQSMLALDMLGDATTAYAKFAEEDSPYAPILMEELKGWLAAKQADPGEMDPAHIERLEAWIAEHDS